MTLMEEAIERKHYRAPREDFGRLVEPPADAIGALVERNRALAAECDYDVQGRPLMELSLAARGQMLAAAWRYSREYRDVGPALSDPAANLFLAGHQPQLFHPGVWYKNFALARLAQRLGGTAVNLVIDSDTIKTASLRVPSGTPREPFVQTIALDSATAEIPFEERSIVDRGSLESFGDRATAAIASLVTQPLAKEFWPLVVERARATNNLGACLAQARHQQEGLWGARTLELPQSAVCDLPAFHWFACHLIAQLPRLHEVYNRAVAEYREANHIRSTAHPVPDLASEDGWLEAPFWIWDRENPRRRRLFARARAGAIELSDRQAFAAELSLAADGAAGRAAEQWGALAARGYRLRTRALMTTLFARLVLGDLFLHGIGGAKYDQVTDAIVQRFFGLKPPGYVTLTATLRLPAAGKNMNGDDARRVDWQLRDLEFHPERSLPPSADEKAAELAREKRRWIVLSPTRENARQRCRAIRGINDDLQPWVAAQRQKLLAERQEIAAGLRAEQVLASREYAFCLHPASTLKRLLLAD